jgi:hypothetical protein
MITDVNQSLIYIDGVGHRNKLLIGNFAATISAMTWPVEFEPYDGYSKIYSEQRRSEFDFSYRTMQVDGYKIHLVYNAMVSPNGRDNTSINSNVDLEVFTWDLSTRPEVILGARSSAHFVIDSTLVNSGVMESIENILYGDDVTAPYIPTVEQLLTFFEANAVLRITDHGDGTWTAEGPDDVVQMLGPTTFQINWASAVFIDADSYTVRSL